MLFIFTFFTVSAHSFVYDARHIGVAAPATFEAELLVTKQRMKFTPSGVYLPQPTSGCEYAKSLRVQALINKMLSECKKVEIMNVEGDGAVRDASIYIDDMPVGKFLVSRKLASYAPVKTWCN